LSPLNRAKKKRRRRRRKYIWRQKAAVRCDFVDSVGVAGV